MLKPMTWLLGWLVLVIAVSGCGPARVSFLNATPTASLAVPAETYRPDGPGPFPGVLLLHGCEGVSDNSRQWARWLRGRIPWRRELWPIGLALLGGWLFWFLGAQSVARQQSAWFIALQELLPRMRVAMSPWVPSSWMARALGDWLNERWMDAGLFSALLVTTALVAYRLTEHVGAGWLWTILQTVPVPRDDGAATTGARTAPMRPRWWMRHPLWACLANDLALLRRDPSQWGQGAMFFGLLGAYFANIHRLTELSQESSWRIGLALLNLACTLLVFGSLAVRFVFPQMSLEGRRLWLLRMLPGGIRYAFWSKLAVYGGIAVVVIDGLLGLSSARLAVPGPVRLWLAVIGATAGVSLVALTLGLGARWVDVHMVDPARLVSSSNGALTLVAMLAYVGAIVWSLGLAWKSAVAHSPSHLVLAGGLALALSVVTGVVAVTLGLRRIEQLEF